MTVNVFYWFWNVANLLLKTSVLSAII